MRSNLNTSLLRTSFRMRLTYWFAIPVFINVSTKLNFVLTSADTGEVFIDNQFISIDRVGPVFGNYNPQFPESAAVIDIHKQDRIMQPISSRDVNFFILEFLLIIGFILYPFTIYYNSRAPHFVRNFFDIFLQILNFVDCHNYWRVFCAKSMPQQSCRNTYHLQNRIFYLQTQQSFHMRHLLSTVSIVIHFCVQLIHCYYNIKIIDTQKGWISPPCLCFSLLFSTPIYNKLLCFIAAIPQYLSLTPY